MRRGEFEGTLHQLRPWLPAQQRSHRHRTAGEHQQHEIAQTFGDDQRLLAEGKAPCQLGAIDDGDPSLQLDDPPAQQVVLTRLGQRLLEEAVTVGEVDDHAQGDRLGPHRPPRQRGDELIDLGQSGRLVARRSAVKDPGERPPDPRLEVAGWCDAQAVPGELGGERRCATTRGSRRGSVQLGSHNGVGLCAGEGQMAGSSVGSVDVTGQAGVQRLPLHRVQAREHQRGEQGVGETHDVVVVDDDEAALDRRDDVLRGSRDPGNALDRSDAAWSERGGDAQHIEFVGGHAGEPAGQHPRSVGGNDLVRESPHRSTARANSMAYIGLPADSSWIRASVGRGTAPTIDQIASRVSASESGLTKISSCRSCGTILSPGGTARLDRSAASTTTGSSTKRRIAYLSVAADTGSNHCTSSMAITTGDSPVILRSVANTRRPRSNRSMSGDRIPVSGATSPKRSTRPTIGPCISSSTARVTSVR